MRKDLDNQWESMAPKERETELEEGAGGEVPSVPGSRGRIPVECEKGGAGTADCIWLRSERAVTKGDRVTGGMNASSSFHS